jgi:glycosyltransferase involved in cell wall biosynthesis
VSQPGPLVSVVTPFFDTEAYLAECIESVLAQSYGNFEYLLVDNQSRDRSGEIARGYAQKDRRIRVIQTPEFFDQVANYNFSLRNISPDSRYMKMVQADDWIFPRCLSDMIDLAEANPSVAIVSSYELKETEVHGTGLPPWRRVIPGRKACRLHLLEGIYMFGSPTALLVRADIVRARDPFYAADRFHEDTEAVYEILRDHDFGFVPQVLSYIRAQQQSITGASRSFDPHALDRLILVKEYGPEFLSPEDYAHCLDFSEGRYYHRLAAAVFARRSATYWDYHRRGLATIGETIDRVRLANAMLAMFVDWALTPKRIIRTLVDKTLSSLG